MSNEGLDITEGINSGVWKAIDKSIENNSKETFYTLKKFVRNIFHLSIKNNSLKHFQEYIFFPAFYYSVSFEKAKHDTALSKLHKICSEQAAMDLKEIIWFGIGSNNKKAKDIQRKKTVNIFYYWAFNGFGRLLYYIAENSDFIQFQYAINQFEQLTDGINNRNYELKYKIKDLKRENLKGVHNEKLKALIEEKEVFEQFDTYKRHTLTGIKYWIMFLYQVDKIGIETAVAIINRISIPIADSDDLLNDVLFFRNKGSLDYMGWSGWDYKERPDGKSYSPPDPAHWMSLGFMADQIRENRLYVNLSELDSDELSNARFLYDDLKGYTAFFEENFERWKDILKVKTLEQLQEKCKQILSVFAEVKRKSIGGKEKAIATAPLNQEYINNFKEIIGKSWKAQARIHKLFKSNGIAEQIADEKTKLRIIGQRTFFEKAKMMFIEGENNSMIYGIDRMGGETGRWEDNEFFNTILKGEFNKVSGSSILDVIDKGLTELKNKGISPSLILLSPEYSYKDKEFLENKRFVSKLNEPPPEEGLPYFYLGTFDSIPIYSSHSVFLNNKVVLCDFKRAFKMRYKSNHNWYENELTVDVSEVTNEEAERRLQENPGKWKNVEDGIVLTDEDALTLIKTSVIIDIWTTLDFQILDKKSYVVGYIKTENLME